MPCHRSRSMGAPARSGSKCGGDIERCLRLVQPAGPRLCCKLGGAAAATTHTAREVVEGRNQTSAQSSRAAANNELAIRSHERFGVRHK